MRRQGKEAVKPGLPAAKQAGDLIGAVLKFQPTSHAGGAFTLAVPER